MPSPLSDLLAHDGFRSGVAVGVPAAALVALAALVARRRLPVAGLAFACAVDAAVAVRSLDGADLPSWALPVIVTAALVGGGLVAAFDRVWAATGIPPLLLAVTTLGIYLTTPDTERSAVLVGVALPLALLGWPRPLASLGVPGSFAAVAVVAWVVVADGSGRDGAVVGGLACLGLLVLEPVVRRLSGGPAVAPRAGRDLVVPVALHVALVAACSRVAGLRETAGEALLLCALAYCLAALALVVIARSTGPRRA